MQHNEEQQGEFVEKPTETTIRKLLLHENHANSGAKFLEAEGWLLPAYYSDPIAENLAVRNNVGIMDISHKGYLKISGPDRGSFLQGIITNDVVNIKPGDGLHAAILTVKGRTLADFIILSFEDHFILETESLISTKLLTILSRYKIREKITIEQLQNIGSIAVQGPNSESLIARITGSQLPELRTYDHTILQIAGNHVTIRKQSITGEAGYIITTQHILLPETWESLLKTGKEFNPQPIGYEAMESLRIEAGIPRYGQDLTEDNIPLEIENEDMISFNKGCYVGQEIIARLKFLGQANKHLKGLHLTSTTIPPHDAQITKDEKEVGRVTSGAYSPSLKQSIAMAYLRREYSTLGTQVIVETGGSKLDAAVTNLPFIKR